MKEIKTLINCPLSGKEHDCCGCLNGKVDEKGKLINFYCNECGAEAGYISPIEVKKGKVVINQEII